MSGLYVDMSAARKEIVDWQVYKEWSARQDGQARVAMRASYGYGYSDALYASYASGAKGVGIETVISYHYAYPQYNSPSSEATWFVNQVEQQFQGQQILMLDFEENNSLATAEWAIEFLGVVKAHGHIPVIYADLSMIADKLQDDRLPEFGLILADWTYDPANWPPVPAPWKHLFAWQYSDNVTVPGLNLTADGNVFFGVSVMNENMIKQATDVWNANSVKAAPGTGIFQVYLEHYPQIQCGTPVTKEITTVDWSGNAIICQQFSNGVRIEYYPQAVGGHSQGENHGYTATGKVW